MSKATINYTIKEVVSRIETKLDEHIKTGDQKLDDIERHVIITNGKVKNNGWIAKTALSLTMLLLGWFIAHLTV